MILTCPACRTRYQSDSAHFKPPGRNVRCAKCGEVWFEASPTAEHDPDPVLAPMDSSPRVGSPADGEPEASADGALKIGAEQPSGEQQLESPALPRRSWAVALSQSIGWAVLVAFIGAIGWATVQYRDTIVSLWPQSATFYSLIGMPVNIRGIAIIDIAYSSEMEDGQTVLAVTGKLVNVSGREQPVPELRVILTDDAKRELYHWTFDAGIPALKPGAQSPFTTRLSSPPPEARNINVRFSEVGEAR